MAAENLTAYYQARGFSVDMEPASNKKKVQEEEEKEQRKWYERLREDKYGALYHMGFLVRQPWMTASVSYLHRIAELFIRRISEQPELELMREATEVLPGEEDLALLGEEVPFVHGTEFVGAEWIRELWQELQGVFCREMKEYQGSASMYFTEYNSKINVAGRVFFHLVESQEEVYPFAFMATYSTKPARSKKAIHTPLKNALKEFKDDQKKLLGLMATVARAADNSELISSLMESGELFSPLRLTSGEAYTFLKEIPVYEAAGIMCRVPDWWRKRTNALKLNVSVGDQRPSAVGMEAMMDFKPVLTIDGEELSEEELREFLRMAEGLIQYKGKWVEINKKKLEAALKAFERAGELTSDTGMTMAEAMRMELTLGEAMGDLGEEIDVSISNGQWLKSMKEKLQNPRLMEEIEVEDSFGTELRAYQKDGYEWLNTMADLGFGACLADDMGLGKTVQMLAFLEHIRVHKGGHALLVLPASLMGNWQKEIEKFTPGLTFQILHKSAQKAKEELQIDESCFLTITTYGMVQRLEALKGRHWDILILDEAQAIKNAGTKQSRSVKALQARIRIAMTGTPIENRLGDLWSLFDFLNQGLLGNAKEFSKLSKKIQEDEAGYARLRKTVSPFILRRLKTDRSIISDLPDKIEIREYAGLTKKQIVLYQRLVREIQRKLDAAEGIERKGLILSSIMKFKQICNHPDQYLAQEGFKKESSGKFEQLERICETIYEKRERVLIFTQFREMTEPLSDFLETIFHKKGLVLHGGTAVKNRNKMVEAFNGEEYIPYMVLSLKAGGVGLNLTGANHVIHFDRWWNPAVENQATDRAFRIGQTKNVMVHKFVTRGTIEEKIDTMIEEKQKLASDILSSSGEQWITEMDNRQIMELLTLGGDVL